MLPSTTQSLKLRLSQQSLARRQAQVLANFMATQVRCNRSLSATTFAWVLTRLCLWQQTGQNQEELLQALNNFQKEAASKTVPWFIENMPPSYFRTISEKERLQHINAITALVNAQQPEVMLKSVDNKIYSYIRTGANYPGLLADVMAQLPKDVEGDQLARVKIFSSLDDTMGLDIFRFGAQSKSAIVIHCFTC